MTVLEEGGDLNQTRKFRMDVERRGGQVGRYIVNGLQQWHRIHRETCRERNGSAGWIAETSRNRTILIAQPESWLVRPKGPLRPFCCLGQERRALWMPSRGVGEKSHSTDPAGIDRYCGAASLPAEAAGPRASKENGTYVVGA